ncbi:MAG: bacillithiol biosynthesis BshC, partial [Myxococcota bacterium]
MLQGFASAYYQCDPRSSGFLEPRFTRVDERRGAVETARARRIAPALLRAIQEQNEALGPSVARAHQLEKLTQPGAAVVVTGQQLGLFLGPLYTVYKALTAVEWAKRLEAETGHPVVPVFWLQTEDHDFDEVAVFRAAEAAGALEEIRLPKRSGRRSISSLAHDDAIEAALEVLRRGLEGLPEGEREFERFRSNYVSGRPWVDSFTQTMAEYFQDEGLVFLNPRCAEVAELAAPIHARAVEESDVVGGLLLNRAKELESKGFKVQVPIRPECTLSFYHPDGNSGDRFRLRPGGGDFELAGRAGSVSSSEVRKTLDTDPLCFSSSALLRPIVQDTLLPTAA